MKIGILGNGQLGQMLKDSIQDQPHISVSLYDLRNHSKEALQAFLADQDIVSFETENIPADIVTELTPVTDRLYPPLEALKIFQHRIQEKTALRDAGIKTADFAAIHSPTDIRGAASRLGLPLLLKTTTEGYDGKGQFLLKSADDAQTAWDSLGQRELIAEAFVTFNREISVIACRNAAGEMVVWPITENQHHEGILRLSTYPAPNLSKEKQATAERYIKALAEQLDYVGTITLELFETDDGLIANEVAPRVHNSGHWTIEGTHSSQFRNHMLAISGQKLEATHAICERAIMVNIIGDETPTEALENPEARQIFVHSYGKDARPNRKLGHVTALSNTESSRQQQLDELSNLLPSALKD